MATTPALRPGQDPRAGASSGGVRPGSPFCFFLMIRRPPRSTPFPYTTLFRSAAGRDGALWFTEFNSNQIGRITTAGYVTEYPIPTAGSWPIGIVAGPDGALWFTEQLGDKIGRITTAGYI